MEMSLGTASAPAWCCRSLGQNPPCPCRYPETAPDRLGPALLRCIGKLQTPYHGNMPYRSYPWNRHKGEEVLRFRGKDAPAFHRLPYLHVDLISWWNRQRLLIWFLHRSAVPSYTWCTRVFDGMV